MRSSNGRVCSWFQWPRIVLSHLSVSLSLFRVRGLSSHLLVPSRSATRGKAGKGIESEEKSEVHQETRGKKRERRKDGERWKEKQLVRGSSVRETFDLVEIPLISSVPLRARTSAMKRERRVGGDTSDRAIAICHRSALTRLRFLTIRDVNYSRVSTK